MSDLYTVDLNNIISEFNLETIFMPENANVLVDTKEVSRPGLSLCGFFDCFQPRRIEIIGRMEHQYLESRSKEEKENRLNEFLSHKPVALVITRDLPVDECYIRNAKKYNVPLLRTSFATSEFMAALIASLSISLAPRITTHGVLVEVYGEGLLITGNSGIGKSETAIELVKRGHRLIADDAVEIKKVSAKTLVGNAPEIIRHYVELRGIGIIDVRRIFGMGSVKQTEKIDLVVALEPWDNSKDYDRFGLESEFEEIMGIKVPKVTIPVHPGRNLAIILEIAAMNNRQKKMGYNTPEEFNKKLMAMYGDGEK